MLFYKNMLREITMKGIMMLDRSRSSSPHAEGDRQVSKAEQPPKKTGDFVKSSVSEQAARPEKVDSTSGSTDWHLFGRDTARRILGEPDPDRESSLSPERRQEVTTRVVSEQTVRPGKVDSTSGSTDWHLFGRDTARRILGGPDREKSPSPERRQEVTTRINDFNEKQQLVRDELTKEQNDLRGKQQLTWDGLMKEQKALHEKRQSTSDDLTKEQKDFDAKKQSVREDLIKEQKALREKQKPIEDSLAQERESFIAQIRKEFGISAYIER
jgi:hypothetical protein